MTGRRFVLPGFLLRLQARETLRELFEDPTHRRKADCEHENYVGHPMLQAEKGMQHDGNPSRGAARP
jgi:hypothetical protein